MATAITFNGYSLQNAVLLSNEINRYNIPDRDTQTFTLSFSDRQKVVSSFYKKKTIIIAGTLVQDTEANLQASLSELKKNLNPQEAVLTIPFNGVNLNYQATMLKFEGKRKNYNVSFINYAIEFQVVNPPFGKDSASQNHSNNGITGATESDTFTIGGEIPPEPVLTLTVNSETSLTAIQFSQDDTGNSITITPAGGYTAADIIVISTITKSVLLNGVAQDYTGIFPSFIVGTNNYTLTFTSTTHNVDLDIDWQDYYL